MPNVDHYFTIGRKHVTAGDPCQDYALSGSLPDGGVYGVVADGCSGANAHTDIGARVLAHAFVKEVATIPGVFTPRSSPYDYGFVTALRLRFRQGWFTSNPNDYLATVVGFRANRQHASVFMFGDGVIMLRYRDGRHRILAVDWHDNMPYYLAYGQRPQEAAAFREPAPAGTGRVRVTDLVFSLIAGAPTVHSQTVKGMPFAAFEEGWLQEFDIEREGILALAVATDGATDLGGTGWQEGPGGWMLAAAELLGFKNNEGAFVKRRAIRALDAYARKGVVPRDDLALAVAWFGAADADTDTDTPAPPAKAAFGSAAPDTSNPDGAAP